MTEEKNDAIHSFRKLLIKTTKETREEIIPEHKWYKDAMEMFKDRLLEAALCGEYKIFVPDDDNCRYLTITSAKYLGLRYEIVDGGIWFSWCEDDDEGY